MKEYQNPHNNNGHPNLQFYFYHKIIENRLKIE